MGVKKKGVGSIIVLLYFIYIIPGKDIVVCSLLFHSMIQFQNIGRKDKIVEDNINSKMVQVNFLYCTKLTCHRLSTKDRCETESTWRNHITAREDQKVHPSDKQLSIVTPNRLKI